ncbi:MAG: 50S ribosomal protein L22 [Armatimonadetes bacterium]|nr:50S ribosomal protein L22 [Armatimonadota bacterium]MDE2206880.1 50S ribosomal protein L22 [Armatimonadota bacterium]
MPPEENGLAREATHREHRRRELGRQVRDDEARAVAKFVRVPPRKARLVIDEVRGLYATDAIVFLRFIPNRAAQYIQRVVASAIANAARNHDLQPERLKVVEARVDEGPRQKRVQPRAQGRAYRILKRTSHITIVVRQVEPKPAKPRKVETGGRAAAARQAKGTTAAPAAHAASPARTRKAPAPAVKAEAAAEAAVMEAPAVVETVVEQPVTATPIGAEAHEQANESVVQEDHGESDATEADA